MPIVDLASVAATLAACLLGWLTVRHCRYLIHHGIGIDDGGGYAVLILVEFTACMAAVGVAVNL